MFPPSFSYTVKKELLRKCKNSTQPDAFRFSGSLNYCLKKLS